MCDYADEEWRPVVGYEDLYLVSNMGRIYSAPRKTTHGGILKQALTTTGYYFVNLSKGGQVKPKYVHRLVAMSFIPNPKGYEIINHKDENKLNNTVDNLEWCDNKQRKAVLQYTTDGKFVKRWPSIREAGRLSGVSRTSILRACKRNNNNLAMRGIAGGFKWCYEEDCNAKTA